MIQSADPMTDFGSHLGSCLGRHLGFSHINTPGEIISLYLVELLIVENLYFAIYLSGPFKLRIVDIYIDL